MDWVRGDDYFIKSTCGRYTIARIVVHGGERFELWRGRLHVSSHGDPQEARAAAETHASDWDVRAPEVST